MLLKIKAFIKNEAVLVISFVLAIISACFVGIDSEYIGYIDYKTLGLLFCLMAVTSAFNNQGVFSLLAVKMLKKVKSTRSLSLVFCLLCFFSSMLITNDVALITFVPFTILTLKVSKNLKPLIPLVTLETISANLGSMLTPIGNPQNLFLFSKFNMTIGDFISAILPYASLSLVLIIVSLVFIKSEKIEAKTEEDIKAPSKLNCVLYAVLFILAMLTVFRVLNFIILLAVTIIAMLILDRKAIKKVDYSLILTFVFLFVFIGNLGRIDAISAFLQKIIVGNEVLVGVLSSQVFSNVPAAILLSGFSNNAKALLIGVNLGGLGTLIASMASLISFKFVAKEDVKTSKYVLIFTIFNIVFLAINLILWLIIK